MLVVGIDLAGSESRQTGFCVLRGMKVETLIVYSDDEIIRKIEELKPRVIAIDAPLSLPKGRKSIDEKSNYT
jgi:predicted nuclease with RNAse H fold